MVTGQHYSELGGVEGGGYVICGYVLYVVIDMWVCTLCGYIYVGMYFMWLYICGYVLYVVIDMWVCIVAKSHCFTVRLKILGVVSLQTLIISLQN